MELEDLCTKLHVCGSLESYVTWLVLVTNNYGFFTCLSTIVFVKQCHGHFEECQISHDTGSRTSVIFTRDIHGSRGKDKVIRPAFSASAASERRKIWRTSGRLAQARDRITLSETGWRRCLSHSPVYDVWQSSHPVNRRKHILTYVLV